MPLLDMLLEKKFAEDASLSAYGHEAAYAIQGEFVHIQHLLQLNSKLLGFIIE